MTAWKVVCFVLFQLFVNFHISESRDQPCDLHYEGEQNVRVDCSNRGLSSVPDIVLPAPNQITELNLERNNINELGDSLAVYSHLLVLKLGCNGIWRFSHGNFKNLSSLRELYMNNNRGRPTFSEILFSHLPELKVLNLACTTLDFKILLRLISNAPFVLSTLVVDFIELRNPIVLTERTFNLSSLKDLRRLSLTNNKIIAVDYHFLAYLPDLEYLNIGYNTIVKWSFDNHTMLCNLVSASKLISLDISHIYDNIWKKDYCAGCHSDISFYFKTPSYQVSNLASYAIVSDAQGSDCIPPRLRFLFANGIPIASKRLFDGISVNTRNLLQYMNLSGFSAIGFSKPVEGFNHLEVFDLSGCGISVLPFRFFSYFPRLRILFFSGNKLSDISQVVSDLTNLEVLDISQNGIVHLPNETFIGFDKLQFLDLSGNLIQTLSMYLNTLTSLLYLDLSHNKIKMLERAFMSELDELSSYSNLTINIENNPLACTCDTLPFVRWVKTNMDNRKVLAPPETLSLRCLYKNESSKLINEVDPTELKKSCEPAILVENLLKTVMAPVLVICVVLLACVGLCYRLRWQIWWEWKVTFRKERQTIDSQYCAYIVYIACGDSAIASNFVQLLQTTTGEHIQSSKDILFNESEFDRNGELMHESRNILFFIDRTFIDDINKWMILLADALENRKLENIAVVLDVEVRETDLRDSYIFWRLSKSEQLLGYFDINGSNTDLLERIKHFMFHTEPEHVSDMETEENQQSADNSGVQPRHRWLWWCCSRHVSDDSDEELLINNAGLISLEPQAQV